MTVVNFNLYTNTIINKLQIKKFSDVGDTRSVDTIEISDLFTNRVSSTSYLVSYLITDCLLIYLPISQRIRVINTRLLRRLSVEFQKS